MGSGKASEIAEEVKSHDIESVLFDDSLKSVQVYNLAKLTGVPVIDREKLILDIFSKRAATTEAKLQVELAELRYEIPRAREKVRLAREGEQPGFFGLGRYEVDTYFLSLKRRISSVSKKLRKVGNRRKLYRGQRARDGMAAISIAGYTGAGKTSLFNRLAGESKPVAEEAFTTLTTTTRGVEFSGSRALISDTVGFISRLPAYVIEAFKSTLEELAYADLVLLVVDVGDTKENAKGKFWECMSIMFEIGVAQSKILPVFNKADTLDVDEAKEKVEYIVGNDGDLLLISAKTGLGIDSMKEKIHSSVIAQQVVAEVDEPKEQ